MEWTLSGYNPVPKQAARDMGWQWIVLGTACTAVATGCLVPNRWLPRLPNDKLLHFTAFGGIAALALPLAGSRTEAALWLIGLLVASGAIECLQELVPGRHFCWRDLAANAAGIGLVALCALLYGAM